MKLSIEIHTQECYYKQLRETLHKCVNEAFDMAETNAAKWSLTLETINGESKFIIKTDQECRDAMVKYNASKRCSKTK